MKTNIIKVGLHQIEALQDISRRTFRETFGNQNTEEDMRNYLENSLSKERLTNELAQKNSHFFFLFIDDHLAGYLKLNTAEAQTEREAPNALEVERIYLLKDYQGCGAGQLLLDYTIDYARQHNHAYVWLGVWEHNHKALAFYKRNGFKEFSQHVFKLGSDEQTDIMMRRTID